ncbi:hypothetical protein STTU_4548 [Streptomyces sp. Tu6071]|nr:hypothetical protein STTU_4548 [Streptomyces sp. Tu6071]
MRRRAGAGSGGGRARDPADGFGVRRRAVSGGGPTTRVLGRGV